MGVIMIEQNMRMNVSAAAGLQLDDGRVIEEGFESLMINQRRAIRASNSVFQPSRSDSAASSRTDDGAKEKETDSSAADR